MPRVKSSDQIEALERQQRELVGKLREAKAKAAAEAKELQRRKSEIAGALILKEIEQLPSGSLASNIRELLHTGITKAADRALFGLAPLPKATKQTAE